jgi:hypothetical protein
LENTLQEIIEIFKLSENSATKIISKSNVINWMKSNDIEVLGAIYSYITKPQHAARVTPALIQSDYSEFLMRYFERCFYENPDGDWSDSRYAAARGVGSWFRALWKEYEVNKNELVELKNWLARVYKKSDESVRRCIVDGTLEHLFENHEIAIFFNDWMNDFELAIAYKEATQWSA